MDKMMERLNELENRIEVLEGILNIRERFEKETGRDSDMLVFMPEDLVYSRPWKEI